MKVMLSTLTLLDNKKVFQSIDKADLDLVLSYIKLITESVPYEKSSTLCPRNLRGMGLRLPLELGADTKSLEEVLQTIKSITTVAMQQIEDASLGSVRFFYQMTENMNGPEPCEGDIILLQTPGKLDKKGKLAKVTGTGKTSIDVMFPDNRKATYPRSDAILLYRPAWAGDNPFQTKKNVISTKRQP